MIRILLFLFCLVPSFLVSQSFVETSHSAGIDHMFDVGDYFLGGGLVVLDFDSDGWEDIYVTGGNSTDKLFRNMGDGTFLDVTVAAGLNITWAYNTQGAAVADIDNDGHSDIFLAIRSDTIELNSYSSNFLLYNNGDGTFTEISEDAGLDRDGFFTTTACFGDINKDGYTDLYVGNYIFMPVTTLFDPLGYFTEFPPITLNFTGRQNQLFINSGDMSFADVTSDYNVYDFGTPWQVSFFDYDNDGDLDIYNANDFGGLGNRNKLYRNDYPTPEFTDVSEESGMDLGIGAMGLAIDDYNADGFTDVYITNGGRNYLMENNGNGTFHDVTFQRGVSDNTLRLDSTESRLCFIYERDPENLEIDIVKIYTCNESDSCRTTTFLIFFIGGNSATDNYFPSHKDNVYAALRAGFIDTICFYSTELSTYAVIDSPAHGTILSMFTDSLTQSNGWGCNLFDIDNDADLDLFVSNGSMGYGASESAALNLNIPNSLYLNNGNGSYSDISFESGIKNTWPCKGSVTFDYDKDGDLDIAVMCQNDPTTNLQTPHLLLYKNESSNNNNWIRLKLIGTESGRDAIGTKVQLYFNGQERYHELIGSQSSQSQSSQIIHFGLADAPVVDSIRISWPSGLMEWFKNMRINEVVEIIEGSSLLTASKENQVLISSINNPFVHELRIILDSKAAAKWQLSDVQGRILKSGISESQEINISTMDVPPGPYIFAISQNNYTNSVTLVKTY